MAMKSLHQGHLEQLSVTQPLATVKAQLLLTSHHSCPLAPVCWTVLPAACDTFVNGKCKHLFPDW